MRVRAGVPASRPGTADGFTIPSHVSVSATPLRVPRIGWLRIKGNNPYHGHPSLQARIRKEGTATQPRWYAYVYAMPADQVRQGASEGSLGLDRNVGQHTDSQGTVHRRTDTARLDARLKRYQRRMARKQKGSGRRRRIAGQLTRLHRKHKRIRSHDTHHISRRLAATAHTVVIEDLRTQGMTQSAQGTVAQPGQNVKAKAGRNRSILTSGWGQLERQLMYKCGQVIKVKPHYTSQMCSRCGGVDQTNRITQARFCCLHCGFALNANWNAALNILGRADLPVAHGTGAAARRGALPWGTPMTREHGMLGFVS